MVEQEAASGCGCGVDQLLTPQKSIRIFGAFYCADSAEIALISALDYRHKRINQTRDQSRHSHHRIRPTPMQD